MGYAALCGIARQVGKGTFFFPVRTWSARIVQLFPTGLAGCDDVAKTPEKVSRLLYRESLNCFLQMRAPQGHF